MWKKKGQKSQKTEKDERQMSSNTAETHDDHCYSLKVNTFIENVYNILRLLFLFPFINCL
jgi:hypothetical protein